MSGRGGSDLCLFDAEAGSFKRKMTVKCTESSFFGSLKKVPHYLKLGFDILKNKYYFLAPEYQHFIG